MSIKFGSIDKILPNITPEVFNNIGKHNKFILILNTDNRYPDKGDPIILRYDGINKKWIYVADKNVINFGFCTETLKIDGDFIALSKVPLDEVIWDIFIRDEDGNVVKILKRSEVSIKSNIVSGLKEYNGKTISIMYCFGTVSESKIADIVNEELSNDFITTDLETKTEKKKLIKDKIKEINKDIVNLKDDRVKILSKDTDDSIKINENLMSKINLINNEIRLMVRDIHNLEERVIFTTDRILINDDKIELPTRIFGNIIHNMAVVFDGIGKNNVTVMDVTCINDDKYVYFDKEDNLNGLYAVVSYLTILEKEVKDDKVK